MKQGVLIGCVSAVLVVGFLPSCAEDDTEGDRLRGAARTLTDAEITAAVWDELRNEHAVDVDRIRVTVSVGVVTLRGTVDNLIARERAVLRAQLVKGVQSVSDRLTVSASGKSDPQVADDIRASLARNPATESFEVQIDVDRGHVTLGGRVDSHAERELAGWVAMGVSGVRSLTNRITLRAVGKRPDFEIKRDVEQRLKWDALIGPDVLVDVREGMVVLYGTVGSLMERYRAAQDAWVTGVRRVDTSGLEVRPWGGDAHRRTTMPAAVSVADEELSAAVVNALHYDPRVARFDLNVTSRAGVVTLSGSVATRRAMHAAVELAKNTVGVVDVHNEIDVGEASPPSDEAVALEIREALDANPFTEAHEIGVRVTGGVATLAGEVDTSGERAEAVSVAEGIRGVVAVRNRIRVARQYSRVSRGPYLYPFNPHAASWRDLFPRTVFKSDDEIAREIADQLFWSPYVDADQVEVAVDQGRAVLRGTVDSQLERSAAETNALEGGAIAVVNRLEIKPGVVIR